MKNLSSRFIVKLIAVAICGIIVFNFGTVTGAFGKIIDIFQPIFIGVAMALIFNVPMEFFENKVLRKLKRSKLKRFLSLTITLILFAGIFALIFGLAVPAAIDSIKSIYQSMDDSYWEKIAAESKVMNFLITQVKVVYKSFAEKLTDYVPQMLELATNVIKTVANIILGTGIAIMILGNKHGLKVQTKKFLTKVFKDKKNLSGLFSIADIALTKFSRYMGGQVIEAVILGTVCYLCMLILRLPYAVLISLIIGFVNLIPIIGAYVGGALGAILIFSVNPTKALIFVVFVIILQQVESFTTYPVIVGKYVGLNGFWIMVSIVIWGGLLGFWGVFLGVPFTAFLHDCVKMWVERKDRKEVLSLEGKTDMPPKR